MFEKTNALAARRAEAVAAERRDALAARVAAEAPKGIAVTVEGDAVVLTGRGLARRALRDPGLRWIGAEMAR